MRGRRAFPKTLQQKLKEAQAGNRFYALMSGKPELDYGDSIRAPVKRTTLTKPSAPTRKLEREVNTEIHHWAQRAPGVVLYRNNRGQVELPSGGRLTYGVGPNGASDWIGYRVIIVTENMVGQRIAQFAAVEAKRPGEQVTPDQRAFISGVIGCGGVAGCAHSAEEAAEILKVS